MNEVFIISTGIFLPNSPISNDEMEDFLGRINGKDSRAKDRILKQNGIKTRYFAIDKNQQTTHSNAQLAANAIQNAIQKSTLRSKEVELLCTGTTQADLPIPGFASMVHAHLDINRCEVASFQSVCA
ncbi:MAG: 3-oxoacyl-ACP synthase, partial [Bacteroidetes bacterium]|nr:3-oxoacyl-ACP synthase [Bacteroidota bacterium]